MLLTASWSTSDTAMRDNTVTLDDDTATPDNNIAIFDVTTTSTVVLMANGCIYTFCFRQDDDGGGLWLSGSSDD